MGLATVVSGSDGDDVVVVEVGSCVNSGEAVERVDAMVDVRIFEMGFDVRVQMIGCREGCVAYRTKARV